jgi:hypothetical protein
MEGRSPGWSHSSSCAATAALFAALLVMVSVAFVGCGLPRQMPSDFGFTAAYGVQARNVLDTFTGTFTKDIINPNKPNPTVELRLTHEELATLYQGLVDISILDYPAVFRPEQEDESGVFPWIEPHDTYLLTIRAAGGEKHIFWEAGYQGGLPRATALRDWFTKLEQIIEAKPEYQAMPPIEGGYL